MAFVQNTVVTYIKQPQNGKVQILPADTTTQKTAFTAGASNSKITALMATSTDTAARDVQVSISNGGTVYPLGVLTIPLGSGTVAGVNAVNLLNLVAMPGLPIDSDGQPYLLLIFGDTLTVSALTTVTAAKAISVTAIGGDF